MYDEPPDIVGLAIIVGVCLVIILIVVLFVLGVSREVREPLDARKSTINLRLGFPVEVPQDHPSGNSSSITRERRTVGTTLYDEVKPDGSELF